MNKLVQKLRFLTLAAAAAFALGAAELQAAVGLSLSTSSVANDFSGKVSLTITGLPASSTVLVEKFADLNANGVIDGTDPLVRSFTVTDGVLPLVGGVRNINIAGDDDGATNGQIRVDLDQPGIDGVFASFSGGYIYRVSDPANASNFATQPFAVTQHSYPQGVQGHVTRSADASPVAGAFVVLFVGSNGNAVGGTFTDATGFYQLQTLPGNYQVIAIATGLVTDQSTANAAVVASSFTTHDQALAAGTFTLSGQLTDAGSAAGIPGIFINASTSANLFSGAFTDANGNYTFAAVAGQWGFDILENQLAQLGYLRQQNKPSATITSASVVVNMALPKATALIYGTVKDNMANVVNGISLNASDQANTYEGVGQSIPPNGNYAVGVLAGTWYGNVSTDNLPAGYIAGQGSSFVITAGQAIQANVVLQLVTAHLQGTVTNTGVPVTNAQIDAFIQTGGGSNFSVSTMTDGSGNFDLGVVAGNWSIALDNNTSNSSNLVGPNLSYTLIDGQTISGIAYHAVTGTGTISGVVNDLSGNPISNANVSGSSTISSVLYNAGSQTDGTGHYSFPVINGIWNVNVYANGPTFNPKNPNVVGPTTIVNFIPTVVTSQPQPQSVSTLGSANFSINTNAPGSPTFQWQVSTNGGSVWNNLSNGAPYSGVTTTNLGISSVTNAMNGYKYRCVVTYTGTPGVENSFAAQLNVNPVPPNFTQQPTPQSVAAGQTATFTAQVSDPAATFQWQISTNGGSVWNNVTDDATYSGSTTGTLTITNPTSALNGDQYRMVATDVVTSNSNPATLAVGKHPSSDFDGDGKADILWSNTSSGDRYFWLMNGGSVASSIFVGTIATQWTPVTGDFSGDGKADILWSNTSSGDRYFWLMNGGSVAASIFLGTVAPQWVPTVGDFNGDGKADILWSNTSNGDRYIWLMNGGSVASSIFLGTVAVQWTPTVADFDGDGKADILWSNTSSGDRYFWLMNGGSVASSVFLGTVPPQWTPVTGDFNGDGKADILWSNTSNGDRYIWLMNGGSVASSIFIGTIAVQWVPAVADFNGDGKADILWSNTSIGDRYFWLMNGGSVSTSIFLGTVAPVWQVAP